MTTYRIKPLRWENRPNGKYADGIKWKYFIRDYDGEIKMSLYGGSKWTLGFKSIDDAKEHAQNEEYGLVLPHLEEV